MANGEIARYFASVFKSQLLQRCQKGSVCDKMVDKASFLSLFRIIFTILPFTFQLINKKINNDTGLFPSISLVLLLCLNLALGLRVK